MDPTTETVVDPTESAVATEPSSVLGIPLDSLGESRDKLNGLRVQEPEDSTVYLIDRGERREVDPATYDNLFIDRTGIHSDLSVRLIPVGLPMEPGAVLTKATGTDPVYLVESGTKRWIRSLDTMARYHFASSKIAYVPPIVLKSIRDGEEIKHP